MDVRDGLQLLPGTKKRLGIKVPGENRFLYIGSAILGAVIVTSFWLNFSSRTLKAEIKSIDEQIEALEQKRNKQSESNIREIQRQLNLAGGLVNEHIYFSQAILKLASLLQEKTQVKNLSVNTEGKVNISGFALSYTVIAKQMAVFLADDSVTDLSLGKMESQADGTIKFSIQLEFKKDELLQKKK